MLVESQPWWGSESDAIAYAQQLGDSWLQPGDDLMNTGALFVFNKTFSGGFTHIDYAAYDHVSQQVVIGSFWGDVQADYAFKSSAVPIPGSLAGLAGLLALVFLRGVYARTILRR